MAPKRMSSPPAREEASKKGKAAASSADDEIPIASPNPRLDRILSSRPTTREEKLARGKKLKEWLEEQFQAKRDKDGVHSDEDALAKFHYLLRHDLEVRGKPSKAAQIIMQDYGFRVPKELIIDLPEADRVKLLKYGALPSRPKEHGD